MLQITQEQNIAKHNKTQIDNIGDKGRTCLHVLEQERGAGEMIGF